jgi:type II secretory pathway component PulF
MAEWSEAGGDESTSPVESTPEFSDSLIVPMLFVHVMTLLGVSMWLYFVIPKWKKVFEDFDVSLPRETVWLIIFSDLFVNYWYVVVLIGAPLFTVDYLLMRWLSRRRGLATFSLYAAGAFVILLAPYAIGQMILNSGPNPWKP